MAWQRPLDSTEWNRLVERLEEARETVREFNGRVAEGVKPSEHRTIALDRFTVAEVAFGDLMTALGLGVMKGGMEPIESEEAA